MNGEGILMTIAIVEFTSPFASPDGVGPLGNKSIGVVTHNILIEDLWIVAHTLIRWLISQALYEDVSLYNHG